MNYLFDFFITIKNNFIHYNFSHWFHNRSNLLQICIKLVKLCYPITDIPGSSLSYNIVLVLSVFYPFIINIPIFQLDLYFLKKILYNLFVAIIIIINYFVLIIYLFIIFNNWLINYFYFFSLYFVIIYIHINF
jgi:hypothetical protein